MTDPDPKWLAKAGFESIALALEEAHAEGQRAAMEHLVRDTEDVRIAAHAAGIEASAKALESAGSDWCAAAAKVARALLPKAARIEPAIYVASRTHHAEMWRDLRAAGWPIVSTWIDEAGQGETRDLGELWQRVIREVGAASGLVFYAVASDFPLKGAYIEVGAALALGKPVVVVLRGVELEPRSSRPVGSWLNHPAVTCRTSLDEASRALLPKAPE